MLLVVLVAGVVFVARSGHTSGMPVSQTELRFRAFLEQAFYARPRTKELMIGHPAFMLAAMAALLWLIHREDAEEQRATLITDVLWMEQNFSFQFERNNALLVQLGPELLAGSTAGATTEARLKRALVRTSVH